jgi:hypothetical protein
MLTKHDETTVRNIVKEEIEASPTIRHNSVMLEHIHGAIDTITENLELTTVDREKAQKLEDRVENLELDVKVLKSAYK